MSQDTANQEPEFDEKIRPVNLHKLFPGLLMKNQNIIHTLVLYVFLGGASIGGHSILQNIKEVPIIAQRIESIEKAIVGIDSNAVTRSDLLSLVHILKAENKYLPDLTDDEINDIFEKTDVQKLLKKRRDDQWE